MTANAGQNTAGIFLGRLGPFMPSVFTRMFQKALTKFQEKGRLITTAPPSGEANLASDTDGGKAARGR